MMSRARLVCVASFLLSGLFWSRSATARDFALTKDCEDGFRRFIHMAQVGQLGDDVTNANIGVFGDRAHVELVRRAAPNKVLFLTPKMSPQTICRYFDIAPGDGSNPSDVVRVGKALDEVFGHDPFEVPGLEAWSVSPRCEYGQRLALLSCALGRMMVPASIQYTIGVIMALALVLFASVVLLCGSSPSRSTVQSTTPP